MDPFRTVKAGEPVGGSHPVYSSLRHNLLSRVAKREQGVAEPGAGPGVAGPGVTLRYGVVSSATAAAWDNGEDTLARGEVVAWEFDGDGAVDREGPTVALRHWWTAAPVAGSLVAWIGEDVMLMTCDALDGWS